VISILLFRRCCEDINKEQHCITYGTYLVAGDASGARLIYTLHATQATTFVAIVVVFVVDILFVCHSVHDVNTPSDQSALSASGDAHLQVTGARDRLGSLPL